MKSKLKLLIALVMSLTMMFGMSTTAFAEPTPPAGLPLQINECTDTGTTEMYIFLDNIRDGVNLTLGLYNTSGALQGWVIEKISDIESIAGQIQYGKVYHAGAETCALCPCNSTTPPDDPTPSVSPTPAHIHSFQWQTIIAPTKDSDGLEGEVCSCGATRNTQPLSAYGYALNDYATPMINAAKAGQTITFDFGEWNSFPKSFMAKLVDKSSQNITFVFHYKWNHVKQEITIPAGTPIDLNFDWYGPAKMAELYGNN